MDFDEGGWAIRHRNGGGEEDIAPMLADAADVHSQARQLATDLGGSSEVLRSSDDGWQVVATYTDQGAPGRGAGLVECRR